MHTGGEGEIKGPPEKFPKKPTVNTNSTYKWSVLEDNFWNAKY